MYRTSVTKVAVRFLILLFALASLPAYGLVLMVQSAEPSTPSLPDNTKGWAAVALSGDRTLREVRVRLVYDPYFQLVSSRQSTRAFIGLFCGQSDGVIDSLHVALYLQGEARIENPMSFVHNSITPDGGYAANAPKPIEASGKLIDGEWADLQVFELEVGNIPPCYEPFRTLGKERTMLDRLGDDYRGGFVLTEKWLGQTSPTVTRGNFLGIAGPHAIFTTPLVGGIPPVIEGIPFLRANLTRNPPGLNGVWAFLQSPSEITSRQLPSNYQFVKSDPPSSSNDFDLTSVGPQQVTVSFTDKPTAELWRNLERGALVYLSLGMGIIAGMIYDIFRSRRSRLVPNTSVLSPVMEPPAQSSEQVSQSSPEPIPQTSSPEQVSQTSPKPIPQSSSPKPIPQSSSSPEPIPQSSSSRGKASAAISKPKKRRGRRR